MAVSNVTPPVLSGTTRVGSRLGVSRGTWTSDDPLLYTYQWQRCDAGGGSCSNISGATAASYTVQSADVGQTLRAVVTATETDGTPSGDLLRFEPPGYATSYAGYTTVVINNDGSNGYQVLNDSTDYILDIDDYEHTDALTIIGGRNVVCKDGGRITINDSSNPAPVGLVLWPRNGAKHYLEGLHIRPGAGDLHLHDGIAVRHNATFPSNASSRIALQNFLVGPCSIRPDLSDAYHSDIIQFQSAYPGEIWTDRFTGYGDYTGLMYSNSVIALSDFHRMNLRSADVHPSYSYGLAFYQGTSQSKIQLDEFYNELGPGLSITSGGYVYPGVAGRIYGPTDSFSQATVNSDVVGDYLEWLDPRAGITGKLREGVPAGGDFVTTADCGPAYVSPGYA